ncbi:FIG024746: hypothetical protein [hydrothermal vent metagenome]|uniref:Low-complexity protein n=1 Tax=hydrothermal vent metagenome TaxID=652676 RepID=A0A3B0WF05_9ZZZZ
MGMVVSPAPKYGKTIKLKTREYIMKKLTTVAASAAIAAAFAAGNVNATENPFGMQQLESNTNVAMSEGMCGGDDKAKDGKCGEGKCGGDKAKDGEAKK